MRTMRCSTAGLQAGDQVQVIAELGAGMLDVVDPAGVSHLIMEGDLEPETAP